VKQAASLVKQAAGIFGRLATSKKIPDEVRNKLTRLQADALKLSNETSSLAENR